MERLINYSNPTPTKLHLNLRPSVARLGPIYAPRLGFTSSRTEFRRVNSLCCDHEDPFIPSSSSSSPIPSISSRLSDNCVPKPSHLASSPADLPLPDGSVPKLNFLHQIAETLSQKEKVIATGTLLLLSSLFMFFLHPLIVPPAFASFQTATRTGNTLIRSELLNSAWTGFFAGCLHTLSGPDHLAALAPLSIGQSRIESAAIGALWGCGHDAGQVLFGLLFLLLKDKLRIEFFRIWGSRVVGSTLVVIGALGIKEALEIPGSTLGPVDVTVESPSPKKNKFGLATFATGIVHGLQPDGLMMVLPAVAMPSRLAGAAFLGMFLVGTVIAMGSYTAFIGSCSQALKERVPRITEKLTWASSMVAIALGFAIIISQFLGFSLY